MRKRFIPSISGSNTIKLFDAETGQLYKMVNTGCGKITGQPIVTENEMYVEVTETGNQRYIKYYSLPNLGLKKTVSLK
jgi:hypothetical protein